MQANIPMHAIAFALAAAVMAGCAAAAPSGAESGSSASNLERYFPLVDGHVYTYETSQGDAPSGEMFMMRVQRIDATTAELHTGSRVKRLEIAGDAIRRTHAGVILHAPLELGSSWGGDNGGRTSVSDTNVTVTVPAGTFHGCIRTVEQGEGTGQQQITTVFCPDVGITQMRVEQRVGEDRLVEHVNLRAFGPPMDLGKR